MSYPTYLVHFNPNHDPKTGKFTFSKYVDKTGTRLSEEGRKRFGVDDAVNQKNLRKSISKMSRNISRKELAWDNQLDEINNKIQSALNAGIAYDDIEIDLDLHAPEVEKMISIIKDEYVNSFIQKYGEAAVNKKMKAINVAADGDNWLI